MVLAVALGIAFWAVLAGGLKTFGEANHISGEPGLDFVATALTIWLIFGPWKRPGAGSIRVASEAFFFAAVDLGNIQHPIALHHGSLLCGVLQGALVLFVLATAGTRHGLMRRELRRSSFVRCRPRRLPRSARHSSRSDP